MTSRLMEAAGRPKRRLLASSFSVRMDVVEEFSALLPMRVLDQGDVGHAGLPST